MAVQLHGQPGRQRRRTRPSSGRSSPRSSARSTTRTSRASRLVAAAGNEATDYTKTDHRRQQPDFASEPGEAPYEPDIPPSCISMPSEGNHVIPVSATGPSTRKSYYSDYGKGYIDVAAPGGDAYDTPDGSRDITGAVLAAYPKNVGLAERRHRSRHRRPDERVRRARLRARHVRLLPVPARHVDGIAARSRCRGADRVALRIALAARA